MMSNALKQEVLDLVEAADNEQLELVKDVIRSSGRGVFSTLPAEEVAKLNAVLEQSERDFGAGLGVSFEEIMSDPEIA